MPINSIRHDTAVSVNDIRQDIAVLSKDRSELSQKISRIKNTVTEITQSIAAHKKNIAGNQSLLKSLRSVSGKYGENAAVRLKNDHFKYGQASNFVNNMFHGSRYQTEREAAVKKINAEGSTVSAGQAIKALQIGIGSALKEVNGLKTEVAKNAEKIDKNEAKKYSIQKEIDKLVEIETDAKKADEENLKNRQKFSSVYQSNEGCRGINEQARYQFGNGRSAGKVSGSKVVEEYRMAHGDDIFSRGNKALESTIKANCSDLSAVVATGAKVCYTPTAKNMTTFRGQGMTQSGINALISGFNTDKLNKTETVYKLGQFFSTSRSEDVAHEFANLSQDEVKVIFRVKGNSSNGLSIPGGLSFKNKEKERLYSPLANFKVTAVSAGASNSYNVSLEEVTKVDRARILPY
ncbi:ADP-ribosyltransferase domain-containing protein [Serratia silvae]|uniref:NAD(+)--protein-arginine ADP-ribosyltransferase n=1 Tax=Serratia silvae TaxID=2824122 RepID=A0ABT0KEZ9_9GAMM|nr:ADP-ribosyltransferase domain-containing protein [Serratia silvae]MCL1030609.1 hypothetical protein [Serratia silvae]